MTRSETASGSRFMGQRIKRREDPRLLRGQGCFVDDVSPRGLLHVAFKRSDIAHGRIVSIDASSARVMDGVEGVYTGDDLRNLGLGPIPLASPFPSVEHFAVTPDVARYVGDPVAVVVAADRYVAADALAAIVVEYEPLPVFTDAEAAVDVGIEGGIHPSFPGNIALHLPAGTGVNRTTREVDDSAWESAVASADVVIRQRMVNQRVAPTCMEGRGLVADWDAGREELTIWASTQVPHPGGNSPCIYPST